MPVVPSEEKTEATTAIKHVGLGESRWEECNVRLCTVIEWDIGPAIANRKKLRKI